MFHGTRHFVQDINQCQAGQHSFSFSTVNISQTRTFGPDLWVQTLFSLCCANICQKQATTSQVMQNVVSTEKSLQHM